MSTDNYEWCNCVPRHYVRDPVDNGRVLRDQTRNAMFEWCKQNCKGRYWIGMGFGQFEDPDDVLLFKLRWG